jgi:hypothetical protein
MHRPQEQGNNGSTLGIEEGRGAPIADASNGPPPGTFALIVVSWGRSGIVGSL